MKGKIWAIYFSPTGNTRKVTCRAASAAALARSHFGQQEADIDPEVTELSITPLSARDEALTFAEGDLVFFGMPTYAGRLPNKIMPFIRDMVSGGGAFGVPLVTYGNRSADDALMELNLLMRNAGFRVLGGGVFVCQHAFAKKLASGRPDAEDMEKAVELGRRVAEKLRNAGSAENGDLPVTAFPGHNPPGAYYVPKGLDGQPAVFLKAKPKRDPEKCTCCGLCAGCCPMGSIRSVDYETAGICIKCQACIEKCPAGARFFDDAAFLSHKAMLEQTYADRRQESEIFL